MELLLSAVIVLASSARIWEHNTTGDEYLNSIAVAVNGAIRLNCTIVPAGYGTYQDWQRNASGITWWRRNVTNLLTNVEGANRTQTRDILTSQLVLTNLQVEHSGLYGCFLPWANTSCASIEVQIGSLPGPATRLRCTCNDFRHTNCSWSRGGQTSNLDTEDELERKARRRRAWSSGSCSVSTNPSCTSTSCYKYCDQDTYDVSLYRVVSSNALGSAVSADEYSFNTDTETIPNEPSYLSVRNLSASSLKVTWKEPKGLDNMKDVLRYRIKYKREGVDYFNTTKKIRKYEYLIENLEPNSLYHVQVGVRFNPTGQWTYTSPVSVHTSDGVPVDAPEIISCEVADYVNNTKSINITWKPLVDNRNGEIQGYVVELFGEPKLLEPPEVYTTERNETNILIAGVLPGVNYTVFVYAQNSVGLSRDGGQCKVSLPEPPSDQSKSPYTLGVVLGTFSLVCVLFGLFLHHLHRRSSKSIVSNISIKMMNSLPSNCPRRITEVEIFDHVRADTPSLNNTAMASQSEYNLEERTDDVGLNEVQAADSETSRDAGADPGIISPYVFGPMNAVIPSGLPDRSVNQEAGDDHSITSY